MTSRHWYWQAAGATKNSANYSTRYIHSPQARYTQAVCLQSLEMCLV